MRVLNGTLIFLLLFYKLMILNMLFHTVLQNKKTIQSNWLGEEVLSLGDKTFHIPDEYSYEILEVTEKYIARPDILSMDIYGDTLYTDLICKLNGISNPFELNEGMVLIIPSPSEIVNFMYSPVTTECDTIAEGNVALKPTTKTKKDKRKANEAIVGDTRFKIDKTRGIVIY